MSGYQPFATLRAHVVSGPPAMPVVDRALVGRPLPVVPSAGFRVPAAKNGRETFGPHLPPKPMRPGSLSYGRTVGEGDVFYVPDDLLRAVCLTCGLTKTTLLSVCKKGEITKARQIGYWAMKRFTNRSMPAIGRLLGNRDHTTILYGVRRVNFAIAELGLFVPADPVEAIRVLHQAKWPRLLKRPLIVRREVSQ